jgi:hypothetical protein
MLLVSLTGVFMSDLSQKLAARVQTLAQRVGASPKVESAKVDALLVRLERLEQLAQSKKLNAKERLERSQLVAVLTEVKNTLKAAQRAQLEKLCSTDSVVNRRAAQIETAQARVDTAASAISMTGTALEFTGIYAPVGLALKVGAKTLGAVNVTGDVFQLGAAACAGDASLAQQRTLDLEQRLVRMLVPGGGMVMKGLQAAAKHNVPHASQFLEANRRLSERAAALATDYLTLK